MNDTHKRNPLRLVTMSQITIIVNNFILFLLHNLYDFEKFKKTVQN